MIGVIALFGGMAVIIALVGISVAYKGEAGTHQPYQHKHRRIRKNQWWKTK